MEKEGERGRGGGRKKKGRREEENEKTEPSSKSDRSLADPCLGRSPGISPRSRSLLLSSVLTLEGKGLGSVRHGC